MSRTADPSRKPALLAQVLEYLLDKPLATLTFRSLAEGLSVSTYTLVYHFGTRAQLIHEIVTGITERQDVVVRAITAEQGDLQTHLANLRHSWKLSLAPRARQFQRLEFEAAMLEMREPGTQQASLAMFHRWHQVGIDALVGIGLDQDDAEIEARMITDMIYGLHYDLIVSHDEERASAAFERAIDAYEERLIALVGDTRLSA
ncbi:TetR/AcrR family transcriptional regulator [Lacisediminihabitans changchengi]|uniref:TetR/AcrR family transcriptional regulator n=1 Tax=Lacisediminihabitans changchengi TaxID=2787634 RepID=A0A934SKV0_9MICO|nr:TetR/AcrR family transcriptional regulator [Lacisediminihabitans changchengi]MBK4347229.1 TetR/AcrR family transcriptional regulator [Lacisediminihabitans changchengi]